MKYSTALLFLASVPQALAARYIIDKFSCADRFRRAERGLEQALYWARQAAEEMPTERCQRGKNALLELGLNFLLGPDPEVWKKVQKKFKILSQIRYDGDNYKDRIPGHTGKAGDPGKLTKEILKYDDYIVFCDAAFIRTYSLEDQGEIYINAITGAVFSPSSGVARFARGRIPIPVLCLASEANAGSVNLLNVRGPKIIALNPKPAVQKFWFDSVPFGQEYINKTQTLSEEMRNVNGTAEFSDLLRGLDATYLEAFIVSPDISEGPVTNHRDGNNIARGIVSYQGLPYWDHLKVCPAAEDCDQSASAWSLAGVAVLTDLILNYNLTVNTTNGALIPFDEPHPDTVLSYCLNNDEADEEVDFNEDDSDGKDEFDEEDDSDGEVTEEEDDSRERCIEVPGFESYCWELAA